MFLPKFNDHQISSYTAIEEDLYSPKGYYIGIDHIPIIFDSGCTVAITPFIGDFVGPIQKCNKTIGGLTGKAVVSGEGKVI